MSDIQAILSSFNDSEITSLLHEYETLLSTSDEERKKAPTLWKNCIQCSEENVPQYARLMAILVPYVDIATIVQTIFLAPEEEKAKMKRFYFCKVCGSFTLKDILSSHLNYSM
jgi:hypothetical protein